MKSSLRTKGLGFAAVLIPVIACFLYFRFVVPYHICFKEQIQLFLFRSTYILSYFSKPAALACLGGDFLTQFLYFKTGGAVVVTLLLVMEWWLIFLILKRFSFVATGHAPSLQTLCATSLLPVIIEWIAYPKLSFSVALSISFILALSVFLGYAKTTGKISIVIGILLIPILYIMAGTSVFLFLILVVLYEIHCGRKRFVYWSALSGLAVALPILLRHSYLLTFKQAYLYPYSDVKQALSLVTLALMVLLLVCFGKLRGLKFGVWANVIRANVIRPYVLGIVLGFVLIAGLVKTMDRKRENLFGIMIEAYHENWDKVLAIAESEELQNPIAACYTNIALSKKSLLGERLMDFYQPFVSGLLPYVPKSGWSVIFAGCDAYYHIGDLDIAQHGAMVGMIFSPNQRSARMVERLAEINLAIGDIPAATKYLRILESTLFHKKSPDRFELQPHQAILKEDMIHKSTDIRVSLELLTESNPDNLPALDYLLCYHLLTKNIPAFFKVYTSYGKGKYRHVPKAYAEALLIYFAAKQSTMKEVSSYGIDAEIIKAFGEYTRLYEQSDGNLAPMQEKFSNTYWLFYHFATVKND